MAELEVVIVVVLLILGTVEDAAFFMGTSRRFAGLDLSGCEREGAMAFGCG